MFVFLLLLVLSCYFNYCAGIFCKSKLYASNRTGKILYCGKSLQVVGGKTPSWNGNVNYNSSVPVDGFVGDADWVDLDTDLYYWTKDLRPVQVWMKFLVHLDFQWLLSDFSCYWLLELCSGIRVILPKPKKN